ncbi:Metallophos domain-containing protein [Durusdinium trenchii]|uniref:Metallophos domain-containing protein n=1 Tax=Durusdinium trenchii TaxID=1381693 RepID=A0ABP0IHI2_9DINO
MFDFDKLEQREQRDSAIPVEVSSVEVEEGFGIYAVSDVHTDKRENMDLLRTWPARPRDVLLLAGLRPARDPDLVKALSPYDTIGQAHSP